MADGDPFPLLQPLNHLPLSTQNDSGSMLMPLDPPEKFTVGEHSPASVLSVLCVTDTRVLLSVTQRFLPFFYSNSRFCAILQKSYLQLWAVLWATLLLVVAVSCVSWCVHGSCGGTLLWACIEAYSVNECPVKYVIVCAKAFIILFVCIHSLLIRACNRCTGDCDLVWAREGDSRRSGGHPETKAEPAGPDERS